jgi:hypothetical protein
MLVRKMMTKEVTQTTIKCAKIEMVNGKPQIKHLPDEVVWGRLKQSEAQKILNKKYDFPVSVLELIPDTIVYEMEVQKFMQLATIKQN